jgi:hypothetical protein
MKAGYQSGRSEIRKQIGEGTGTLIPTLSRRSDPNTQPAISEVPKS